MDSGMIGRLEDVEYRREYGAENAKFSTALALTEARETMGVTQAALAEIAGTSQAYIAKLERGDANPTIGQIGKIFAALWFEVSTRWTPLRPVEVRTSSGPSPSQYEDFILDEVYSKGTATEVAEATGIRTSAWQSDTS